MQAIVDPKMYKHTYRIAPGVVGAVGDVNLLPRFAQSAPDLPMRYDESILKRESHYGSNVQDGSSKSYESGGMGPYVVDKKWTGERGFKVNHGWVYQDLRVPDRRFEPLNVGYPPNYTYYNRIGTVYEARRTGEKFLPIPGPYQADEGEVPRGGTAPRVVATEQSPSTLADVFGKQNRQPLAEVGTQTSIVEPAPTTSGNFRPGTSVGVGTSPIESVVVPIEQRPNLVPEYAPVPGMITATDSEPSPTGSQPSIGVSPTQRSPL